MKFFEIIKLPFILLVLFESCFASTSANNSKNPIFPYSEKLKNAKTHPQKNLEFDPFDILETQRGRSLVTQWIEKYPNKEKMLSVDQVKTLISYISDVSNRTGNFEEKIKKHFPYLEVIQQLYLQKTQASSAAKEKALLFKQYMKGPIVVDVGCGWNTLGAEILKNNPDVRQVIGVDIEDQTKSNLQKNVSFLRMPNQLTIPLPDNSADTVILSFVLHHLDINTMLFLQEIKRILRPDGRIIILEDTFSHLIEPQEKGLLSTMFFDLPTDKERLSFLWFVDWFIHNFVNKSRIPLVPGNYKTIEDWNNLFNQMHFFVQKTEHLGFTALGSRNPVNRGFIILKKSDLIEQ